MVDMSPRKLAAILSTDVVGYSRLMEADEGGTIAALRRHRMNVLEPKVAEYRGRIANTAGDSFLIEYPSAVDALQCAIDMQREISLLNETLPEGHRLEFRVGINIGDVVVEGSDLLGDGVNIAARLQGLAAAGGICISASVLEQVSGKLEIDVSDLGAVKLRNIEREVRAYEIRGLVDGQGRSRTVPTKEASDAQAIDFSRFGRASIVVLPFRDLGGAEQDSLAEGLRLSLHSVLIKLPGVFLLHTATVEGYRDREVSPVEIGRTIGVGYIISGAVQRAGNRVRVTVELTDVAAGQVIWGGRYDRTLEDVFDLQDEVTLEIVNAIGMELRGGEAARIRFQTVSDPTALAYFHRAISHIYRGTREDTKIAKELAEKFAEMEPAAPAALGMIALTHWRDAKFGWTDDPQASRRCAAEYAQQVIDLGDPEGIGHTILGFVRLHERRYDEAIAASSEAQSRRPSCPLSNGLLAEVMRFSGHPERAVRCMQEAMKIARTFPPWMVNTLAAALRDNGEIKTSIAAASEGIRLFPDDLESMVTLCCDYVLSGSPEAAQKVGREIQQSHPSFSISRYAQSQPYKDNATLDRIVESLKRAGLDE